MKQIVYLEEIAKLEQPTFGDLARVFKVSKPSVTAIVTRLILKGYLTRKQSSTDKRAFNISLTEKGRALQQVHANFHRKIARHFATILAPDEQETLARLVGKTGQVIAVDLQAEMLERVKRNAARAAGLKPIEERKVWISQAVVFQK